MPVTPTDESLIYVFVVAGVVIRQNNKYLLVQEAQPKAYGLWNLPAGKVERGLTIKETAVKEAKEETGFDVKLIRELEVFHGEGDKAVKHAFEAEITGGEFCFPPEEILDARWFTYDEVKKLEADNKLRADWVIKAINLFEKA